MGKRRKRRPKPWMASPPKDPTTPLDTGPLVGDIGQERQLSRKEQRAVQRGVSIHAESWAGPLPHPETLARFNEIHPGASTIIFTEFQKQGDHRRDLENRVVRSNIRNSTLGQVFAFVILGGVVAGGIFLVHEGKDIAGFGVVATAVMGGLWALRAAVKAKQQELQAKRSDAEKKK